tara:strand:- start:2 stop:1804 length:1803 start_codon:yes stop_codon:yes gene_type:complete
MNLVQINKKLLFLLKPREKIHAGLLLIMVLIMALLDMIGVASILPFMAVLTNPSLVETNFMLNTVYENSSVLGIENNQQFLFALGILVLILLLFSLAFKALTQYFLVLFLQLREYSIGKRLLEGYLHQPYSWFLNHNSADLGKSILSEVHQVIGGGMTQSMELISKSIITVLIILLLVIVDPKLAIIVGISLGGAYTIIFLVVRGYLKRIGEKRLKSNELRFTTISEAFGAAKEVKIGGLEQTYIKNFSSPAIVFARTNAYLLIVSQIPRFILEGIAFGGVLLIILYKMIQTGSFNSALPIVSLYVFAGYRLMPALQQIYNSLTNLTFMSPSIDSLYDDIKDLKVIHENKGGSTLSFTKKISLKDIYYNYPNASRTALKNINLTIPAKSTIGLVGATGSGKTTTIDIILGLLDAQKGSLEVDDNTITKENKRSWQRNIGYVPQYIYLSDDTVAGNIAFGVDRENINQEAIEKASKIANLHEFVIEELPKQYQTTIGERGVRLSGGQRQRIGIARALYHDPKILVLDEATSALDNQTEKVVMEAINNISKNVTIILIAHRLSTVKNCHKIFLLDKGEIINEGTFEELTKVSENFRNNANNL